MFKSRQFFFFYLPVDPAREHSLRVGLDGDDSLSHPQVRPSISHHTVLFLTDDSRSSQTQIFSKPAGGDIGSDVDEL